MSSRRKKYPISANHGHEKQSRDKLEDVKAIKPRLEVDEHRQLPKSTKPEPKQLSPVAKMHNLNASRLAAERIAEFRGL